MSDDLLIKVAQAINGPHCEVPHNTMWTLNDLRQIRWEQQSANEQRMLLNQAKAAISVIPGIQDAMYARQEAIEASARVAENYSFEACDARFGIARAIRSLGGENE